MYLADRFVEGVCPCCKSPTKGDQCDECNKLEKSTDVVDPKCVQCKNSPVIKTTKMLDLRLDALQPEVEKWLEGRIGDWG